MNQGKLNIVKSWAERHNLRGTEEELTVMFNDAVSLVQNPDPLMDPGYVALHTAAMQAVGVMNMTPISDHGLLKAKDGLREALIVAADAASTWQPVASQVESPKGAAVNEKLVEDCERATASGKSKLGWLFNSKSLAYVVSAIVLYLLSVFFPGKFNLYSALGAAATVGVIEFLWLKRNAAKSGSKPSKPC